MPTIANELRWLLEWITRRFRRKPHLRKLTKLQERNKQMVEIWLKKRPEVLKAAKEEARRIVKTYCSLDKYSDYYTAGVAESIITEMLPETHGYAPNVAVMLKVHPDDFAQICKAEGFGTVEMSARKLEIALLPDEQRLFYITHNGLRIITDADFECNAFFRDLFKSLKHSLMDLNHQSLTVDQFKQKLVEKGQIFTDPIYHINVIAIAIIYPFEHDPELELHISPLKEIAD